MKIFFLLLLIAAGFVAFVYFLESKSVFYPSKDIDHTPEEAGLPYEEVTIEAGNDKIHGWFVARPAHARTVLFFHGNGGNIGDRLDKMVLFDQLGLNVFIIDYSGYGKSTGRPTEQGMYREAEAAYKFLTEHKKIQPASIIVYGESLGGAPAVDLAAKHDVGRLILDSTFSSARDMAKHIYPFVPGILVRTKLDSESKIGQVKAPKLFFHSRTDRTVPFALAQKLYRAAGEPKKFVEIQGGHNDGYVHSQSIFFEEIRNFVQDGVNR